MKEARGKEGKEQSLPFIEDLLVLRWCWAFLRYSHSPGAGDRGKVIFI